MTIYDHWSTAARASKDLQAISAQPQKRSLDGGRTLDLLWVKPLHGEPYGVYHSSSGIRCHTYKVTASDIDGCRRWRPFAPIQQGG